jgi:DNA-binding PadR family transcriptional regulator
MSKLTNVQVQVLDSLSRAPEGRFAADILAEDEHQKLITSQGIVFSLTALCRRKLAGRWRAGEGRVIYKITEAGLAALAAHREGTPS